MVELPGFDPIRSLIEDVRKDRAALAREVGVLSKTRGEPTQSGDFSRS